MLCTRQVLEAIEDSALAPYGFRSKDSRGRAFPQEEARYRTCFQRDRDRSLHRVVCDYIAGMTDRYALQEYAKMFDPFERV